MDQTSNRSILDSYESTENALMDSFKAAAVRVTTLYKDSLVQNRKAYAAGYQQALQDLYEFISSHSGAAFPNSNGGTPMIPAQDILMFARERNAQLMSEMGCSPNAMPLSGSAVNTHYSNQTNAAASGETNEAGDKSLFAQQQQQQQHQHQQHQPQQQPTTMLSPEDNQFLPPSDGSSAPAPFHPLKSAFPPFQIDPNTQFTFSAPVDFHAPRTLYSMPPGQMAWGGNQQENTGDGLKRRHMPTEISFMGRSLSNMNVDMFGEPPFKRNRPKRED